MRFPNALIALLCSFALAFGPFVHAAEPLRSKPIQVEGEPGVWFPRDDADRLLDVVTRRHPNALGVIDFQGRLINLQAQQITTATTALVLTSSNAQQNLQLAQAFRSAYEKEVERNNSIWNEPVLWVVVGVVLGGGVAWVATR